MAHETLHSRYSIKEIAPRIGVGFLSGAVSLPVSGQAISLANAVAHAILGDQLDPRTAGNTLRDLILAAVNEDALFIFLALILIGMTIGLLVGYVIRVGLTIILIAGAPIALMFHALPQTEGIAYGWWRAFGGCLTIQIAQSLALVTAWKVLLAPGGFTPFGTTRNGLVDMVVALALVWVLYRIPFWVLAAIRPGGGRRSLIGSLVRSYLAYRTFGLLTGRGRPATGGGRGPGGAGGGGGGPRPRSWAGWWRAATPARRAYRSGQRGRRGCRIRGGRRRRCGRPVCAVARHHRPGSTSSRFPGCAAPRHRAPARPYASPPAAGTASRAGRRGVGSWALPLDGDWPENRPRAGRDGQYRLPITVESRPGAGATHPHPVRRAPGGRARQGGTQLQLPLDPYRGSARPRAGSTRCPLDVQRTRQRQPRPAVHHPRGGSGAVPPRTPVPSPSAGAPTAAGRCRGGSCGCRWISPAAPARSPEPHHREPVQSTSGLPAAAYAAGTPPSRPPRRRSSS